MSYIALSPVMHNNCFVVWGNEEREWALGTKGNQSTQLLNQKGTSLWVLQWWKDSEIQVDSEGWTEQSVELFTAIVVTNPIQGRLKGLCWAVEWQGILELMRTKGSETGPRTCLIHSLTNQCGNSFGIFTQEQNCWVYKYVNSPFHWVVPNCFPE